MLAWVAGGQAQVGWGIADERLGDSIELVAELAAGRHGPGPWFGAVSFSGRAARFVRPEKLETVEWGQAAAARLPPAPRTMSEHWRGLVETATQRIAAGELEKVVVARVHEQPAPKSAWEAFRSLPPAARSYFLRFDGAFFGATPETLLRWSDGVVEIDALAGSAAPGGTFGEKERREHAHVVRDVERALEGYAIERPAQPLVMELPYVRHLHTPVRARAADFAPVLRRLFPTSAVAGAPREKALEFISRHEGVERDWYAGAVGRVSPGEVDLAVALRCCFVHSRIAHVFAGAGIVAGSDAQAEWEETERKMTPVLSALRGAT
ncbi:MAG: chorismate-binding protein [Myxococcaceae bacterium]|nr:chorismate-binding protein [Myxococcaceae bacterium]